MTRYGPKFHLPPYLSLHSALCQTLTPLSPLSRLASAAASGLRLFASRLLPSASRCIRATVSLPRCLHCLPAENLHLSLLLEELVVSEQSNLASVVALTPPLKPVQAEAASGCAPNSISIRSKWFISPKQPLREIQPQRIPGEGGHRGKEKDDGDVERAGCSEDGAVKQVGAQRVPL
ncbi:hypothetical protein PVAP13_8KG120903 [Panicum virgatum]|uniref:Uncharacterized protein n=1 Tax=Panicum virgatum TaxID=38727 RepID=A0A8T0PLX4_PANVG|nr:hypothetical protein PVAP13_8KG120903 [Panicum virgatum]